MHVLNRVSCRLIRNLAVDAARVRVEARPVLRPLVMTHFVTHRCNLRCAFCHVRPRGAAPAAGDELDTAGCLALLGILRAACPHVHLTGGEPLVRDDIVDLVKGCRDMGFRSVSIATNLSLLHEKAEVLDHVTDVFASLHMFDEPSYAGGASARTMARMAENVGACARLQREKAFRLVADVVLNSTSLPRLERILEFCFEREIAISVGPQLRPDGTLDDGLEDDATYRRAIDRLIALRREGAPVFDGEYYLRTIRDLTPFRCHPSLTPATNPRGELYYPCRLGGVAGPSLLTAGSYEEGLRRAVERAGPPQRCERKCFVGCTVVPSAAVEHPWTLLRDFLRG